MIIEESTVKTCAIYNDANKKHRVSLTKSWNNELPSAAILMCNASSSDIIRQDYTTMFCINSLSELGYGSVTIVNMFSFMTSKLDLKMAINELSCDENTEYIIRAATECSAFIIAIGSVSSSYKVAADYMYNLFEKLHQYANKIHTIADASGKTCQHPLSPSLRNKPWQLVPYQVPSPPPIVEKNKPKAPVIESVAQSDSTSLLRDAQTEDAAPRGDDMRDDSAGSVTRVSTGIGESRQIDNGKRNKRK